MTGRLESLARSLAQANVILAVHDGQSAADMGRRFVSACHGGGSPAGCWRSEKKGVQYWSPDDLLIPWTDLHAVFAAGCTDEAADRLADVYRAYSHTGTVFDEGRYQNLYPFVRDWAAGEMRALELAIVDRGLAAVDAGPAVEQLDLFAAVAS